MYLNNGKIITLAALIQSEDVNDRSIIQIFDQEGNFLTQGNWFQDNIMDYSEAIGVATKVGTGLAVSFRLKDEELALRELSLKDEEEMKRQVGPS